MLHPSRVSVILEHGLRRPSIGLPDTWRRDYQGPGVPLPKLDESEEEEGGKKAGDKRGKSKRGGDSAILRLIGAPFVLAKTLALAALKAPVVAAKTARAVPELTCKGVRFVGGNTVKAVTAVGKSTLLPVYRGTKNVGRSLAGAGKGSIVALAKAGNATAHGVVSALKQTKFSRPQFATIVFLAALEAYAVGRQRGIDEAKRRAAAAKLAIDGSSRNGASGRKGWWHSQQ
eukprot:jgi/Bigna1/147386/aug1.145_g22094